MEDKKQQLISVILEMQDINTLDYLLQFAKDLNLIYSQKEKQT